MPEEELQSSPLAALHLLSHSGTEGAWTEDIQVSVLSSANPSPWPCHCKHVRLDGDSLVCGACQTLYEAHCGCPEPGGASTELGELTSAHTCVATGAALAWSRLGFSPEHKWCSAGYRGCVWGDQEVQRALVLLRMSQPLHPGIFGVLTLLLCSAKGEEKSYLQPTLLPSQCCSPVKGAAGHGGLSEEDDSSVKAIAFCMQLFTAEHLVKPALACGALGCS